MGVENGPSDKSHITIITGAEEVVHGDGRTEVRFSAVSNTEEAQQALQKFVHETGGELVPADRRQNSSSAYANNWDSGNESIFKKQQRERRMKNAGQN